MNLLLDITDRLFSWALLGAAFITIWVASVLIGEQNHLTGKDQDIKQDWLFVREAFRYNWNQLKKHWRR